MHNEDDTATFTWYVNNLREAAKIVVELKGLEKLIDIETVSLAINLECSNPGLNKEKRNLLGESSLKIKRVLDYDLLAVPMEEIL